MPGNRTFVEWSPTIYNDEDFTIYNSLQTWMNSLNSHVSNLRDTNALASLGYQTSADVVHYGKDGSVIKTITLVNVWPSSLAPLDLEWGSNDSIEDFTCTFQYDYWTSGGTTT